MQRSAAELQSTPWTVSPPLSILLKLFSLLLQGSTRQGWPDSMTTLHWLKIRMSAVFSEYPRVRLHYWRSSLPTRTRFINSMKSYSSRHNSRSLLKASINDTRSEERRVGKERRMGVARDE